MNNLKERLEELAGGALRDVDNKRIYEALLVLVNDEAKKAASPAPGKKKLYYISAEFLIGKLLSNNLINLGLFDDVKQLLKENGKELADIEEIENEPSLGNGGLGRLAACFVDSIATLSLPGDGVGLAYHFGLFKQSFKKNVQFETPDVWRDKKGWLIDTGVGYDVTMAGKTYHSK
ncbi:MAG: glycogen/starch/alpha-glucan phosphorylase, partial [Lachnospiraceae bacterium]|nr:glycogen/starch/alpha-glucan phosphorylase [Lachnospiraceae bacterium]